ncbi:hypothetical protein Gotur_031638 [Gossypium turneri]
MDSTRIHQNIAALVLQQLGECLDVTGVVPKYHIPSNSLH